MTGDAVWGALPEDRYVRVMADICADGVWNRLGIGRDCEELAIPQMLVDRIRAWQAWYDDADTQIEAGCVVEYWEGFDLTGFQAEAEAIAADLRAALPADWMVECFDHGALRRDCAAAEARKGERRRL